MVWKAQALLPNYTQNSPGLLNSEIVTHLPCLQQGSETLLAQIGEALALRSL